MKKSLWILLAVIVIVFAWIGYETITYASIKKQCLALFSMSRSAVEIPIYLKSPVSDKNAQAFSEEIRVISGVENVTYVSSAQQLEDFKQKHANDPTIIQALKELNINPLLPSISVQFKSIEQAADLKNDTLIHAAAITAGVTVENIIHGGPTAVMQQIKMIDKISPFVGISSHWNEKDAFAKYLLQECVRSAQK